LRNPPTWPWHQEEGPLSFDSFVIGSAMPESFGADLESFSRHAKRNTINADEYHHNLPLLCFYY